MNNHTTKTARLHVEDLLPAPIVTGLSPSQCYGSMSGYRDEPNNPPVPMDEDEAEESYQRMLARLRARHSQPAGLVSSLIKASGAEPEVVASIKVYATDTVIERRWAGKQARSGGGQRGEITTFSEGSKRRMKFAARNVEGLTHLITLTYPADYPSDGRTVKGHFKRLKQWLIRRHVSGFWFLEFQRRGAPHFHIFTTGGVNKKALSAIWFKIVASGDEKHLRAGTKCEAIRQKHAIAAYAMKYASKMEQKEVPEEYRSVGRFWGFFGGTRVTPKKVLNGFMVTMAPLIRIAKKMEKQRREQWGGRARRDNGRYRYIAYSVGASAKDLYAAAARCHYGVEDLGKLGIEER